MWFPEDLENTPFNFSVWGGPRVRKGTKLVSKTYTDGSTLYTGKVII
jgi:hypothetical protein